MWLKDLTLNHIVIFWLVKGSQENTLLSGMTFQGLEITSESQRQMSDLSLAMLYSLTHSTTYPLVRRSSFTSAMICYLTTPNHDKLFFSVYSKGFKEDNQ